MILVIDGRAPHYCVALKLDGWITIFAGSETDGIGYGERVHTRLLYTSLLNVFDNPDRNGRGKDVGG